MSCSGDRRKSRSHQKSKRKGGKSHKLSYSVRKQMHTDAIAENKKRSMEAGTWKPKLANT